MKAKVFKFPNSIIINSDNLHPSTIGVALVLYAYMGKHRKFRNSLENIARMSFACKDTVRQAIDELESKGRIKRVHNFIYSSVLDRNIYAQSSYRIIHPVQEDYTLIPYAWLKHNFTPCTLQVLLTCRMFMIKDENRAYPSIRKMAALIRVAKSTVCLAIQYIAQLGILMIEHCKKGAGAYSCNSYHVIRHICAAVAACLEHLHINSLCEYRRGQPVSIRLHSSKLYRKPQAIGVVRFFVN